MADIAFILIPSIYNNYYNFNILLVTLRTTPTSMAAAHGHNSPHPLVPAHLWLPLSELSLHGRPDGVWNHHQLTGSYFRL